MGSMRASEARSVRKTAAASAALPLAPQSRNGVIGSGGQRAPITA